MNPVLVLFASMLICMLVIPLMHRLAPYLRMLDEPGERKVHQQPIARVGGFGIVLGAAAPLLLWLTTHPALVWFLFGAAVLLVFGAVDDRYNISHYYKFIGQLIAVVPLVTLGDVYIDRLPLLAGVEVAPWIGQALTVFAIVGMINAMNHSDGLDGLAGGEALLSLIAMCFLAYAFLGSVGPTPIAGMDSAVVTGVVALVLGTAAIGGVLGFLRYNTHPARVFMGDTGSQFLGFSVGFIAVLMVTRVDRDLSP
ncbi:MAG: glycosyltransferase family 4 protein, partial [Gammaproteobacteria bacterium]